MVGIQNTTQKKFFRNPAIFLCISVLLFLLTASFAYAGPSEWIHGIGIGVGGFFTMIGGQLFDTAITSLVLQMGDWINNRGLGSVITSIWTMIRDLFNILFIFSLVYIGLRIIYDSDDSRTKRLLGLLIAAALLINFSLYIAKVVVDISNFTAVQIYTTATDGISGSYGIENKDSDGNVVGGFKTQDKSISGAYMDVLNVSSWFSTKVGDGESVSGTTNVFVYSIMAMLFLMFLGFVLAYGALMLTARFIAIILYLMFSPFMFLGWILPQFESFTKKWWRGFLGYSFFAPVYIFMLYIGLYSLQQIKVGFGENASFSSVFSTGDAKTVDTFSIFLLFAIGTGFLIGATKVAGMMSNGGAAIGMNMADKFGKKIGGAATLGLTGRLGRNSLGWAGQRLADNDKLKDFASKSSVGRGILRSSRVVGNASFDARNVAGAGETLGIGAGKKGGYKTHRDEIVKTEQAFAKSLGTLDEDDKTVLALTTEKISMEAKVKRLKAEKENTEDENLKKELGKNITKIESKIKAQDTKINREKNRRQIGSVGDLEKLDEEKAKYAVATKELNKLNREFLSLSDSDKAAHLTLIETQKKTLKKIDKEVKEKTGSMGYAGTLENRGIISSAIYGRINNQDRTAGKEIRKKYEKEVKKSKEDKNFDSLKDAFEKKSE